MSETSVPWQPVAEPAIAEFGPCRAIGIRYVGKNEQGEIPSLWMNNFMPRMAEIKTPDPAAGAFGVCRCLPDATDGTFEYIAALFAAADAALPSGMVEVAIPRARYVVFTVRNLGEIQQAWQHTRTWLAEHPECKPYCGAEGCDCANFPCFEYYPPDFGENSPFYLYIPIRSR